MSTSSIVISPAHRQPKGLYWLFFTELWERFGFYTVQTILILYLTKGLLLSDNKANNLYAAFNALLYVTPAIGGYLADRYLGFRRAIWLGALLLMVGYVLTALPSQTTFLAGLSVLVCANGLFKPNVSSIVGDLYAADDPRRDAGFTLFYMGINIGSLIPPLLMGWTVSHLGWHSGFLLAAIGMLFGIIIFIVGTRQLKRLGNIPAASPLAKTSPARHLFTLWLSAGLVASILLSRWALQYPEMTNKSVEITAALLVLLLTVLVLKQTPEWRRRFLASILLTVISVGFWALYNQTFTSLTLFADRNMEHHLLGIPVDAEAMQFFNPFFIIILSPLLSYFWTRANPRAWYSPIPVKFFLGVLLVGLGFWTLFLGSHFFGVQGIVSPWWLVLSYFLQTFGELLLSPIGLSMITVLVPKSLTGMMMGVWFFSQALSFSIGGIFANLAAVPDQANPVRALAIYNHAFFWFSVFSSILAVITLFSVPFLNRLIDGSRQAR